MKRLLFHVIIIGLVQSIYCKASESSKTFSTAAFEKSLEEKKSLQSEASYLESLLKEATVFAQDQGFINREKYLKDNQTRGYKNEAFTEEKPYKELAKHLGCAVLSFGLATLINKAIIGQASNTQNTTTYMFGSESSITLPNDDLNIVRLTSAVLCIHSAIHAIYTAFTLTRVVVKSVDSVTDILFDKQSRYKEDTQEDDSQNKQ